MVHRDGLQRRPPYPGRHRRHQLGAFRNRNSNDGGDLNNPNYIEAHPEILFGPQYPSALYLPFPALFADGFESGDTSAWSAAVP